MLFCGCQMWPLFTSLLLILLISALTYQSATADIIVSVVCLVGFFTWITINLFSFSTSLYHEWNNNSTEEEEEEDDDDDDEEMITNHRWRSARTMVPRLDTDHFWVIGTATVMAERGQYRNDVSPSFIGQSAQVAQTTAIRSFPPVKSFSKNVGSDDDDEECPICMESFKNGELIQPFGICFHEFHSSCLYSWLRSGNTTCPVCREDLVSISIK